jgi:acyl carrier protein
MEFEKIREVIADQMGVEASKITEATTFDGDLNADSLDLFQIISELEEVFDMEFSNEAAEGIKTVGDAAVYVRGRIA